MQNQSKCRKLSEVRDFQRLRRSSKQPGDEGGGGSRARCVSTRHARALAHVCMMREDASCKTSCAIEIARAYTPPRVRISTARCVPCPPCMRLGCGSRTPQNLCRSGFPSPRWGKGGGLRPHIRLSIGGYSAHVFSH